MLGVAKFRAIARDLLVVSLAALMVAVGLVPAEAVAPQGSSSFLVQTQTQNLSGINGSTSSAYNAQSVTLNGVVYYVGNGPTTGAELYSTDGTTAGTNLVKDMQPGSNGSANYLTSSNGKIFYSSPTASNGTEPIVSDGTGSGTTILKDINPTTSTASSTPSSFTPGPNGLTYFIANEGSTSLSPTSTNVDNGAELWVTDGTTAGTQKVKDINTYMYLNVSWLTSSTSVQNLTKCNGKMFFTAVETAYTGSSSYSELWVTDGTAAGTQMVKDINTTTYSLQYQLYSRATGVTLAVGTSMSMGSNPQNLTCVNNTLYFTASEDINPTLATTKQLWKSDGTDAGTVKVRPVTDGSYPTNPTNLIGLNNKVYFSAAATVYGPNSTDYGTELWVSDGTSAGTAMVKDIYANNSSSLPGAMTAYNGQLYFAANDYRGTELWKTDGTTAGTLMVKDLNTSATGASSSPNYLYVWNNKLWFTADNGLIGREIYSTTGTSATTVLLKDIFAGVSDMLDTTNNATNRPYFAATAVNMIFVANSAIYGQEMWKTDGTDPGTSLLQDLNTLPGSANAHDATAFNGKIYFSAASAEYGQELWSTDLTSGNTSMLIDIYPGSASGMDPTNSYFTVYNNRLYFFARNPVVGFELWSTDGTAAGTTYASDLYSGYGLTGTNYQPSSLITCNGKLYYAHFFPGAYGLASFDGTTGAQVWTTPYAMPSQLTCFNNTIYFNGNNVVSGFTDNELWKSGGTSATTAQFADLYPGVQSGTIGNSSSPTNLTVYNNKLYFTATNPTYGTELYSTDGVAAPSVIDIYSGATSSNPAYLRIYNNELYFKAFSAAGGIDLMSYNGTTLTPRDLAAGSTSVNMDTNLVVAGNYMWFRGFTSAIGSELFSTDGTIANTGVFEDLTPGSGSTTIANLTAVGGALMYNTYDGVMGSQPRFVVINSAYTVTFNVNGASSGTAPSDISVMSISATVPGNTGAMVKTGYDFVGWNTNALGTGTTYLPGSTITPVVNTSLYAMWASQTSYTITYNANNATSGAVASPLTGVTGLVTLDTNSGALARTGYSFGGWNTNAAGSGTNYASGARYTPTANVTLYAKWTALTSYAITYNLNGATGTAPATVNSYALATVTLSNQGAMVAPAGKTFAGWNTNAVGTGVSYASAETINVQATLTLYAQWSGTPSSTLTYDANGSTSGTVPTALTAAGTYVVIDSNSGNLAKTGYIFSGWNTSADGSGTTFQSADNYLLTANVTLYANWLVANYTVTFAGNANTGGTVPNSITGISISTTIPGNTGNLVRSGYTFAGWNTLSSGLGTNYASGDTFAPTSSVTLYAKWTALPTYTVTYSANGATGGGAPAARSGIYSSITLDNNSGSLVKSGSYFAGWNTQADGLGTDYAAGATYTPTASVTLYAKWSNIATYTLSYNSNNSTSGTAPLAQTGITSTATVSTNSGSLARLGYRFDGWNTNAGATGTSYAASSTITLLADTTLYAVWVAVPVYTVTYNGNGHTSGSVPAVLSSSDASVTLASNSGVLNKTGYSFVGWNTNAAGTGTHYDTGAAFALSASVTLYAEWLGNIYTLTYNANGSTSGSVPAVTSGRGTLNVDNNTGSLAKTGYTFSGWNLAADGTGTNVSAGGTYAPSADTTLFAKWTALPTYTITYNGNTNTSGTAPAATTSYATQTIAAAGSLAKTSYVFTGWNTLANGTGTAYAVGASYSTSANLTLYAQWGLNYQISYDANGASSGTAPATQTGLAGATTVASNSGNLALNGYSFAGWNTLANGTGTSYATGASITSNSDVILYAAWTLIPTYSVTYNANGATSGSAPATQTGITSAVTISANSASLARTGYVFSGWNTSAGGTGTTYSENTNISISANLTLYARWIAVYSISYDGNGATSGSLPPSQSGITSTVTVAGNSGNLVKSGYSFAGWNTNAGGTGTSYTAAAIATLTADLVLYAKWSLIPTYTITYDANGATGGSPAIAASGVSSATALDNNSGSLVKTGYVFGGWNTQANGAGTSYAAGSNFTPTANITLYAQWDNAQTQAAPVQITQPRFAITSVAKRQFELAGGTQTIFGRNLDIVNYVSLDGKVLTIISSSATSMTFAITEHAAGWATLVMKGEGAMLTFTNFVQFVSNKTLVLSNIFNKGVTASTASVIAKLALTIQRARDFKVIQLSFGENTNPASASTPAISMKDNIALMKLAVNLMQLFPKTIDVVVRLTGNTKDLTLIFKNS